MKKNFVELPDDVKAGITAVALFLAAKAFAFVLGLFPILSPLEPFIAPITLAFVAMFVDKLQSWIPDAFGPAAVMAVKLILYLLAAFGIGTQLAVMGVLPAFFR